MLQPPTICTIIAKNYLASARTLCKSFLQLHPEGKCFVLVIDDVEGFFDPGVECFETVYLSELGIPNIRKLCFKYDIVELSTAVKPHLIQYLLDSRGLDKLLYLDPDILVTDRLDHLYEVLKKHDIVLTPHTSIDYPDDALAPSVESLLLKGAFNLGFIGLNVNAKDFLTWWKDKVSNNCVRDGNAAYFVDQKVCDLIPCFFDNYFIEKDPGYNVANWNLHCRQVRLENGQWTCNQGPLYFFHFSNYRLETPAVLSSHFTRPMLAQQPDLHTLVNSYKCQLEANGYMESRNWPYSYDYFSTGELIPPRLRMQYRVSADQWERYGDPFDSHELKRRAVAIRRVNQAKRIFRLGKAKTILRTALDSVSKALGNGQL